MTVPHDSAQTRKQAARRTCDSIRFVTVEVGLNPSRGSGGSLPASLDYTDEISVVKLEMIH
jgi:hypothetical protein